MTQALYIILGLTAGILSGIFGIGGGIILIPALIWFFGMTQHQAQGTTLAVMVPPIGLLAAMRYYQTGNAKLSVAAFICVGFIIGGLLGANYAQNLSDPFLKKSLRRIHTCYFLKNDSHVIQLFSWLTIRKCLFNIWLYGNVTINEKHRLLQTLYGNCEGSGAF